MIESIIIKYLNRKLNIPVYTQLPKEMDDNFIVVQKVGGNGSIFYEHASLAIQSYANTLLDAAKLNRDVKKAMFNSIELSEVVNCSLDSDYNFTDEELKKYRYQAVFDITFYD